MRCRSRVCSTAGQARCHGRVKRAEETKKRAEAKERKAVGPKVLSDSGGRAELVVMAEGGEKVRGA